MKSTWTKHTRTPEEKETLEKAIRGSNVTLEVLKKILKEKHKKPTVAEYDKAAWAYYRADLDGYNRALDEILELLNLDPEDKN